MNITLALRDWSRTFRNVGSRAVADLLAKAATKIEAGEYDNALAAELVVCALTRENIPEQKSAARLMHHAAKALVNT